MAQRTPAKITRNQKIYEEYLAGKTSYVLAKEFDLSQPRVWEIIHQAKKKTEPTNQFQTVSL